MRLCPELTQFQSGIINSKIKSTRLQSSSQQNVYHYILLMDDWHNLKIDQSMQLAQMKAGMKLSETVAEDELYRFVYMCIVQ